MTDIQGQFKKGVFELGATICPIAIKYNPIFVGESINPYSVLFVFFLSFSLSLTHTYIHIYVHTYLRSFMYNRIVTLYLNNPISLMNIYIYVFG